MQVFRIGFKRFFSVATRFRPVQWAMRIAIRLVVPSRRIGVAASIFNDKGEVLLLHHVFHGSYPWSLPGGWVDGNEMPDAAVARELLEETGLSVTIDGVYLFTPSPPGDSLNIYFYATAPIGELTLSNEINEAAWFRPNALPSGMLKKNRDAIQAAVAYAKRKGMYPTIEE